MNSLGQRNEHQLASHLGRIINLYQHGLKILTEYQNRDDVQSCGEQLRPVMKLIEDAEPDLRREIQGWPTEQIRRNNHLRILFREQEHLLKQLLALLDSVEKRLLIIKQRLVPAIDQATRSQQVTSAYQMQSFRDASR